MRFFTGVETAEGYEPSTLHRWLLPKVSGNAINGLGERTKRHPTPCTTGAGTVIPTCGSRNPYYLRQYSDFARAFSSSVP